MEALCKLRFDQPHYKLMLQQDFDLLKELAAHIKEDGRAVAEHFDENGDYHPPAGLSPASGRSSER